MEILILFFKEIKIFSIILIEHLEWMGRFLFYAARVLKFDEYKTIYLIILIVIAMLVIVNVFSKKGN